MTLLKIISIVFLSQLLMSCMFFSTTEIYQQEHVSSGKKTKVQIYYPLPPACSYEVIGTIEINGLHYSKEGVFQSFADSAEQLNATAVVVTYLEQLDIKEYVGIGEAIRCIK